LVLAIGGGSVIDSAKAIALGLPYPGDVWDFFAGKAEPKEALPVGTVLTIPAAGSEASTASVITNEDRMLKRGFNSPLIYPRFSNLNPELTDRLIEATLRTVIDAAPRVLRKADDYDTWAELMWSGTIANNNLLNTGRVGDWAPTISSTNSRQPTI